MDTVNQKAQGKLSTYRQLSNDEFKEIWNMEMNNVGTLAHRCNHKCML